MADTLRDRFANGIDGFAKGFRAVVDDVRHKVLEEGWFGKVVTPRSQTITIDSTREQSLAERFGWSVPGERADRASEPGWFARNFAPEPPRDAEHADRAQRHQAPDRGIDL